MLKTKAAFKCKEPSLELKDCVIEKVIRLDSGDFQHFQNNLCSDYDFIKENNHIGGGDGQGSTRCLLVLDRAGGDGILVNTEGYDYPRYTAFMPGAKYFVEACQEKQSMKFYCPLTAETFDDMDEYERQYASEGERVAPEAYEDYIREKIVEYNKGDSERGLAEYLHSDRKVLKDKVWSIVPGIELRADTLCGVFNVEITEELSPQELEQLRDYCIGQASDAWGEGFEQQEIETSGDEIYVHFWNSGDDYFMLTEDEFEQRMSEQTQADVSHNLSLAQLFEIKMEHNYNAFVAEWRELSPDELIEKADEIAVTKDVWHSCRDGVWDLDYCEHLMHFENPLEVVRDYCLEQQVRKGEPVDINSACWNLYGTEGLENNYAQDESYVSPDQSLVMNM